MVKKRIRIRSELESVCPVYFVFCCFEQYLSLTSDINVSLVLSLYSEEIKVLLFLILILGAWSSLGAVSYPIFCYPYRYCKELCIKTIMLCWLYGLLERSNKTWAISRSEWFPLTLLIFNEPFCSCHMQVPSTAWGIPCILFQLVYTVSLS